MLRRSKGKAGPEFSRDRPCDYSLT